MIQYRLSNDHMIKVHVNTSNFIVEFFEQTAGTWRKLNEETWHSIEDIAEEYGVCAPSTQEIEARQYIAGQTTSDLCDEFELTGHNTNQAITAQLATVRGWIMDEIEFRYPEAFEKWLEGDAEDEALKYYIFEEVEA